MDVKVEDLLESIDRAIATLEARREGRFAGDVVNLKAVRRVIESLDPDEIDALLSDEEDE